MENLLIAKNKDYDILTIKYEKCKKINNDLIDDIERLKGEIE